MNVVLIPLFRSFILIEDGFGTCAWEENVLIPLFRSFILMDQACEQLSQLIKLS